MLKTRLFPLAACLAAILPAAAQQAPLQFGKGEHLSFIGSGLADRMQHSAWLETMIQAAFPETEISVRHLGFGGDEVSRRDRSENFGSPEEWLKKCNTDVVFAFFGFNESFRGPEGLDGFKQEYAKFVKETKAAGYNGKGNPRLVLFSPIAQEKHPSPDLPDPAKNNANLKLYTEAMAEIAKANDVQFIDLFTATQALYAGAKTPLTHNGIHLTDDGEKALAPVIFKLVFGKDAPSTEGDSFAKLRSAVLEKNYQWHQRYRTVDGYNVYGGRSALAYQPGQGGFKSDRNAAYPYTSNYKVMQEEMSVRDVMTANRDKRIWAVAKGGDLQVKDDNLPPVTPVETNLPGDRPDKLHTFLSGEEMIGKMELAEGCKVQLFADEKMFPELVKPVQMAWDTRGRLWVAAWLNYPERTPKSPKGDSLLVLEDTDHDGRADKCETFIEDLNCPTGFQFYKDGVLVMQAPDLWFIRDTDGDGKADWKERVLHGIDSADSHHTTNAMCYEPGGAVYLSDGVFHRTQVETAEGVVRNADGCIYRFEPRTAKFDKYAEYGFANPHGRVFDYWGNDYITDATGNNTYFGAAMSGRLDRGKHGNLKQFWDRPSRPCPATGMLSSRHFPEEFQNNFLNLNVIGLLAITRVKVNYDESGPWGTTIGDLVSSKEPNFRPICVSTAPDGSIFFCDWTNAIIGHMQHHLRDPNRDHQHGRIYRITYPGRPLLEIKKIHGQPIEALVELLKEPEDNVRERAKIELDTRPTSEVIAAVQKWSQQFSPDKKEDAHHLMEALWVHQWHNVVNEQLLRRMLRSPEPQARAQAVRVLWAWRDRVPDVLKLLKTAADDPDAKVRLHAVRACSYFDTAEAAGAALTSLRHPQDYYLGYVMGETMKQLEPVVKKALAAGDSIAGDVPEAVSVLLGNVNVQDLLTMPKNPLICTALLSRDGIPEASRAEALVVMSQKNKSTVAAELAASLQNLSPSMGGAARDLGRILTRQTPSDLKALRPALETIIAGKGPEDAKLAARAAMFMADGSLESSWKAAGASAESLAGWLQSVPAIGDLALRATAAAKIRPLLTTLPQGIDTGNGKAGGRYVRISLPRRGTLTLAEVEVFSNGSNIARAGKAKQSSVSHGGQAKNAIDGNTSGSYSSGSQTHTEEDSDNPWWEVDLGREQPVEAVKVWTRSEANGEFVGRLEGFTLTVLDGNRREVFKRAGNRAPRESVAITVGAADPVAIVRRAAIRALISTGDNPSVTFGDLCRLIEKNTEVPLASESLVKLPRAAWVKERAATVVPAILKWAAAIPAESRTQPDYITTIQAAQELVGLLPADQAGPARATLKDLKVNVVLLKTVHEQLRYDTTRIVVEAGKATEIVFENDDGMPHNFVIVEPAARTEVSTAAMTMAPTALDGRKRAYIPGSPKIIDGTKMLEPGQSESLVFKAKDEEKEYEFVCTFPGHGMVMGGRFIVTKDVDAYLAKNPQTPDNAPMLPGQGQ